MQRVHNRMHKTTLNLSTSGAEAMNSEEAAELKRMSMAQLKERCKERDEKISGKKDELIARLLKPAKA
ncbi:hypothetical protein ACHAXT_009871 [Thalassiosira profunda]